MRMIVEIDGRQWRVDSSRSWDLSIPLNFRGDQPVFFGAQPATARAMQIGDFTGAVGAGGSCNCTTYTITPHCNGTHTESAGHLTSDLLSVHTLASDALIPARVITLTPQSGSDTNEHDIVTRATDRLITRAALEKALAASRQTMIALVVRTLPNPEAKRFWRYGETHAAPYFTTEAIHWIAGLGIEHLLVDIPSLDRSDDGGRLLCHRAFWGMAPRGSGDQSITRPHATVTELVYVPPAVLDGWYVLNLQIAPFVADAAPSRPLLLPLEPT